MDRTGFICVLDIGARYGLHPSWKNIALPITFHLVEADQAEADRLKRRYEGFPTVNVQPVAVVGRREFERGNPATLYKRRNPAISGLHYRSDVSPEYWMEGGRSEELDVVSTTEVETSTLDQIRSRIETPVDFLKLDTEGGEDEILDGYSFFGELWGVRCEVSFLDIYSRDAKSEDVSRHSPRGPGTFAKIHCLLREAQMILLNLEYDGRGDKYHSFISSTMKFGSLQATDAIWIRLPQLDDPYDLAKVVIFALRNQAPDLALHLLELFRRETQRSLPKNVFYEFIAQQTAEHLYKLKWVPSVNPNLLSSFYEFVFEEEYPSREKYNSSSKFNPLDIPTTR